MNVRAELEKIEAAYGELTSPNVVDAASESEHPFHDEFDWDNGVAGPKWRLEQARKLIRSVRFQYVTPGLDYPPVSMRVFHSVPGVTGTPVYRSIDAIEADPIAHQVLVAQMYRDWAAFKARYDHLNEFHQLLGEKPAA